MLYVRHHATLFVDPGVAAPIEVLRRQWDPDMFHQIAAHVTLVYPWEADNPEAIAGWVRTSAQQVPSFHLRLGEPVLDDDGRGCGFTVDDIDGGHAALRRCIPAAQFSPGEVEPHVTIVHPRTSSRGKEAWEACRDQAVDLVFRVSDVAITAWDGARWPTIETIPLAAMGRRSGSAGSTGGVRC